MAKRKGEKEKLGMKAFASFALQIFISEAGRWFSAVRARRHRSGCPGRRSIRRWGGRRADRRGAGSPIPGLRARGRRQHRLLFCDAQSLANRGHLDEEALERARAGVGDAGLIDGLLALVTLLRGAWPRIEGKSPLGAHEVDEAERIARLLSEAIAARDAGAPTAAAAELRARALTRLVNVYGEIRRMVEYLRYHEGDADVLAPSMHARRKRRQRAEETHERGAVLPVATDAEPEDDDAVTGVVRRASGPEEDSGAGPGAMRAATDAVEKRQRAPEVAEEAARASRPGGNGLVR